jgi:hypothetical protein
LGIFGITPRVDDFLKDAIDEQPPFYLILPYIVFFIFIGSVIDYCPNVGKIDVLKILDLQKKSAINSNILWVQQYALWIRFTTVGITNDCELRRKKMKSVVLSFILLLGIGWLFSACTLQSDDKSYKAILNNADAIQAMAIANEWKWSKKEIKSFVTSREVVFKFPNEKEKRIPLPNDKMLVAVAPYINQTHR